MNMRMSTAPHIRNARTTRRLMLEVILALVPCAIAGLYRFGLSAAVLLVVSMASAVLAEFLYQKLTKKQIQVNDFSALLTGLILGLNLPPTAPWWLALIGSAFAIIIVKQLFGGIGDNFMNPAMAARAALLASWPVHMTTFIKPVTAFAGVDTIVSATPLATGFSGVTTADLFMGNIPGAIGEVSKLMILLGCIYLLIARVISWRIPVIMLATTALASLAFGNDPVHAILAGGVMFGAVFMATDYTTTPMTKAGQAIFAAGAGLIVAVIRQFGAYPEGVTYAILIMNILTPLIDKYVQPKLFGKPAKEKAEKEATGHA